MNKLRTFTLLSSSLCIAITPFGARADERLFNGEDFSGWVFHLKDDSVDPERVWSVRDGGVMHCTGSPVGYVRTGGVYADYELTFEWRWPAKPGNNGLLLHIVGPDQVWPKSIEAQLQHENAGDFWVIGGADFAEHVDETERRVPKKHPHNEKTPGQWNRMRSVCRGDRIEIYINGLLQNVATRATLREGHIGFQSEGAEIEFRKISIRRFEPAGDPE